MKVFAKDKNLRYLWCNEHYAKDLGIRPKDIAGKTDFDYFPASLARKYRRDDRAVLRSRTTKSLEEHYAVGHEEQWVHTVKTVIRDERGRIVGIQGIFWDTTEEKRVERDARDNREWLDKITNAIPDPVFVKDKKHRWIFVNDAFCKFIGHSRSTLLGKSDYDFFPKEEADVFWKKDNQVMRTGKASKNEEWFTDRRERRHFISTKKRRLRLSDGSRILIGVIRDITKQKETADILVASQWKLQDETERSLQFKKALDASSIATVITTPEPRILYVNPAWEQLTGYTLKEALGNDPKVLKSGKTPAAMYERMWQTITQGKEYLTDAIVNKRKDGSLYNAELRVYPIRQNNHVQYYVGMQTDITRRVLGEEAKTAFMSLVSHQLRTPLTAIRWGLNLLQKFGTLTPKQEEIFADVHAATARMAETINIMLKLSRIESGELPVKRDTIDLCSIFQALKKEHMTFAQTKNITFTFDCIPNMQAITDQGLLKEVLDNLLNNAIKYTPEGGKVEFRAQPIGDTVRISITDTGIGIPEAEQQKIFSKFFRATNVVNLIPDGTGLGLHLVYALTQLLNGTITFRSKEQSGTTFTVSLPLPHKYGKKNSHR